MPNKGKKMRKVISRLNYKGTRKPKSPHKSKVKRAMTDRQKAKAAGY